MKNFEVEIDEKGQIIDFLSGDPLSRTPEEMVRQRYLRVLHFEYQYPKEHMRREVPVFSGSKEVRDAKGNPIRADIVVYMSAAACADRDQGKILLVVECKAPSVTEGYGQLVSYIYNTNASGGVWFNGSGEDDEIQYFRRQSQPNNELVEWIGIPRYKEAWDALGRRKKSDLLRPKDIRGLLRRCHNRLHSRGSGSEEEDLTMDMVRIILAKAEDEEQEAPLPNFYCTTEEYRSAEGQAAVAERIQKLFAAVRTANRSVFSEHEKITVSPRAVCDVVVELQNYQLLSNLHASDDWDIMGNAYEQYTSAALRRVQGQFFTNRLVVAMMVALADPGYKDVILDPAGGSGGFLTGAMRFVRRRIVEGPGSDVAKQRQLDQHRTRLFMVEQSRRLIKVAKTAMILNGDGHAGMTYGDSLGAYEQFDETIVSQAGRERPTLILTNPPFAGVGEGRITQQEVLDRFLTAKRWEESKGKYTSTAESATGGVPPEMLFFERCLDWVAPGGLVGIVLPKSFLDTATYRPARTILFERAQLVAVMNLHKNTFQPHTGVRTCVVFLRKLEKGKKPPADYPIFMAVSRKIGQDSEGVPIFRRDEHGKHTEEMDHDLDSISKAFEDFRNGALAPSQYTFSVKRSELDEQLRINPQLFLPHLNETLNAIVSLDGVGGWSVVPLGQLTPDTKIFKGPRFNSAPLVVEDARASGLEPYYTPSAVLQEKGDSLKWLDLTHATKKQLNTIDAIRIKEGDICITRSGSIGRVTSIGKNLHDAIVSDDLIRVRISDERMRLYALHFLQTKFAQDQLARNEYGAVQQHLEPEHVSNLLVPLPEKADVLDGLIAKAKTVERLRNELRETSEGAASELIGLVQAQIAVASAPTTADD